MGDKSEESEMNWQLDTDYPYVWRIEGTPFGVEKIDHAYYVPFRMWGSSRVYVTKEGEPIVFGSRQGAMKYTEGRAKEYLSSVIRAV
jgi:hypothetical protein